MCSFCDIQACKDPWQLEGTHNHVLAAKREKEIDSKCTSSISAPVTFFLFILDHASSGSRRPQLLWIATTVISGLFQESTNSTSKILGTRIEHASILYRKFENVLIYLFRYIQIEFREMISESQEVGPGVGAYAAFGPLQSWVEAHILVAAMQVSEQPA